MSKNVGRQLIRFFFILLLFFVLQNKRILAQSLPATSSGTPAPISLTTYLAPYGTPLINYSGPTITLPIRAYDPSASGSGASNIDYVITYLIDPSGIIDYSIYLLKSGPSSYQLVVYDWLTGVSSPWPYQQVVPNGEIQPSSITLSGLVIEATQLTLAGNELQFNLSLNRSGSFDTEVTLAAIDPTGYSLPWSETAVAQWAASVAPPPSTPLYTNRGIGGGGATYGVSFQPASTLAYIASENGTLFRSTDKGVTWQALDQFQISPSPYLQLSYVGFTADPNIVLWVNNDLSSLGYSGYPLMASRSLDQGITWTPMTLPLLQNGLTEHVLYWTADFSDKSTALCATDKGLLITHDDGATWARANLPGGPSQGTFVDVFNGLHVIYHALNGVIYRSTDGGETFHPYYSPGGGALHLFAGAHDTRGLTLAYADKNGKSACAWAATPHYLGYDPNALDTENDCGYVWVSRNGAAFTQSSMIVGDYLKMADNDSQTIYAVGGRTWTYGLGNSVFVSHDAGNSFDLTFTEAAFQGETGPTTWPKISTIGSNADYNAIGLDVGWWDTAGFFSFGINQRNSSEAGGSGLFFAYYTHDTGSYWNAPFTRYADTGTPAPKKKWESTGMEVTASYHIKFNPSNAQVGYVSMSDVGGMETEDGGSSFRMCSYTWNSVYDYSFDPSDDHVVYLASNYRHDYLLTYAGPLDPPSSYNNASIGGIYKSTDRCTHLTQISPASGTFAQDYLSVKYNPVNHTIYAGTWGAGIEVSSDDGTTWSFLNAGLPVHNATTPNLTINQLEVDPNNGNVYALVTGDWPNFTNQGKAGIYFLDVADGKTAWTSLRGTLKVAPSNPATYIYYPVRFAVDWFSATSPSTRARSTLWLVDTDIWSPASAYSHAGIWNSVDGGSNWSRKLGYNYPTSVDLDTFGRVYVTGSTRTDIPIGYIGDGSVYSDDSGVTWKQNSSMQEKKTIWSVTPDPNNSKEIFFGTSGNGLLYGPRPE